MAVATPTGSSVHVRRTSPSHERHARRVVETDQNLELWKVEVAASPSSSDSLLNVLQGQQLNKRMGNAESATNPKQLRKHQRTHLVAVQGVEDTRSDVALYVVIVVHEVDELPGDAVVG